MKSLLAAALRYASAGIPVLPARQRDKVALTKHGLKDATMKLALVREWWTRWPDASIGVVPGSLGAVAFDVDNEASRAIAGQLGLLSGATYCTVTRNGHHVWYRVTEPVHGSPKITAADVSLEEDPTPGSDTRASLICRASGGYVLMPPSVHPSGFVYQALGKLAEMAPLPLAVAELLKAKAEGMARPQPPASLPASTDAGDLEARVRAYLAKVGSRGEGARNVTAFGVAAWLRRDMALPEEAAWLWLAEWNRGNAPPLKEHELRAVFRSAKKHGRRAEGAGLVRDRADASPVSTSPTPHSPRQPADRLRGWNDRFMRALGSTA